MVFYGEYAVSFTGQGRIVLPKKIRELLKGSSFVVTKGFDNCLAGYDKQDWETRASSLMGVSLLDKDNIGKRRSLFASANYIEVDDQGRFVVPKPLLSLVTKKNKAVIIGVGDHFEIWDNEKWMNYNTTITE